MKPTLHALEYSNNRHIKFPATRLRLQGCHHQGVFIIIKVVLLKWSNVCCHVANNRHFKSTTTVKIPWWWQPWVQKPIRGDFVHLYCIYSNASTVGFISWFLHYAWYIHYHAFSWQDCWEPQCSSGQSVPQHIFKLGTSQIHDRSIFTSVILLNSDTREHFANFISDHVIPYAQQ